MFDEMTARQATIIRLRILISKRTMLDVAIEVLEEEIRESERERLRVLQPKAAP